MIPVRSLAAGRLVLALLSTIFLCGIPARDAAASTITPVAYVAWSQVCDDAACLTGTDTFELNVFDDAAGEFTRVGLTLTDIDDNTYPFELVCNVCFFTSASVGSPAIDWLIPQPALIKAVSFTDIAQIMFSKPGTLSLLGPTILTVPTLIDYLDGTNTVNNPDSLLRLQIETDDPVQNPDPVPEPATLMLVGGGLLAIARQARKTRTRASR